MDNLSEDEKKAIEQVKRLLENANPFTMRPYIYFSLEKVVNLIEKQNKESEIKDKMINYMANYINDNTPYTRDTRDLENKQGNRTAKYTTEHFRKKVME